MTTYRATPHLHGAAGGGPTAVSSAPATPPLTSRAFEMAMEPSDIHVAEARGTTAVLLRLWALPNSVTEDARLVVSELVTNAIRHGSGAVKLRVRYSNRQLRVEVTDGSDTAPERRRAGANDVSGRGLFLVSALAQRWGVIDGGRTTYAVIPAQAEGEGVQVAASTWCTLTLEAS
ncbi:ATP-binding protein [Streptomyces sp. NPDC048641]|uniref:ATP-binding protein n=1 Tax=Streptomyces sp. NPDC048641 TaxID=3154825 RepID=UPI003441DA7A